MLILKLRSLFVFVGDGKLFLKISQMLVVCIRYCYNFHMFLFFASESRVAKTTIRLQRMSCGLARMMVLGGAVMKEEDL